MNRECTINRLTPASGTTGSALAGVCLVLLATAGCATLGPDQEDPESEIPKLRGEYTGTVSIMGEQLFGTLSIRQSGEDLELAFNFPEMGIQARGEGVVTRDGFTGQVSYTRSCPGEASLSAFVNPDDRALTGDISTSDCTGSNDGTFRFSPRN